MGVGWPPCVVLGASHVPLSLSEATKGHHGLHAAPYKALSSAAARGDVEAAGRNSTLTPLSVVAST